MTALLNKKIVLKFLSIKPFLCLGVKGFSQKNYYF